MYTYFRTAECVIEMVEVSPSISYSMRKETPLDSISDTSYGMSDNEENCYSYWRMETPIEELGTQQQQ